MGVLEWLIALALAVVGAAAATPEPPAMACDPGFGKPQPTAGCPDPDPQTGWLSRSANGDLVLRPYGTRDRHPIAPEPATICTGAITVGYEEPLHDHLVGCDEIAAALPRHHRIRVAVWSAGGHVVQVSELYHP